MSEKDNYVPTQKWVFDKDVTRVFPDMISRSIPGYGTMRDSVVRVVQPVLDSGQTNLFLLDVGCSRGDTIYDILNSLSAQETVQCIGIDSSSEMIEEAEKLFLNWLNVQFIHADIMDMYITPGKYSVVASVLTAQFIPLDSRQQFFKSVHDGLSGDGVFVLVEKVLGETPAAQGFMVDIYHKYKSENGYTDEQIEEKRKSLQGVLVPLRASENEAMLRDSGFTNIQRFWQCLNFAGWIAFK